MQHILDAMSQASIAPGLSCIICAYNEAPRIGAVLTALTGHPLIGEVLVINDASSDNTAEVVGRFPGVTLVTLPNNVGKSRALVAGLRLAQHSTIMLLDADLSNITANDITALAEPVTSGNKDVTISLRKNAFSFHHMLGIDFTSGERVIPKWLLHNVLGEIDKLPEFGIESYMNTIIIKKSLRLKIVPWKQVTHMRKAEKYGYVRGILSDLGMTYDILRVLSPLAIIKQNMQLLRLTKQR
jgi:glycosyltransferase involved in cell wall biosynthesis